jgi:hypothetical protein
MPSKNESSRGRSLRSFRNALSPSGRPSKNGRKIPPYERNKVTGLCRSLPSPVCVTSLIGDIPEIRTSCSPKEIAEEVFERYSSWVASSRQPTGQEFTDDVVGALRTKVKVHELLISIEGIDLVDQEAIDLGSMKVSKSRSQASRRS